MIHRQGLHHIELDSGDVICWHSGLWHYSPPNSSDLGRIAIAGVYSNAQISTKRHFAGDYHWVLKGGELVEAFPPEVVPIEQTPPPPPFPKAEEALAHS